VGYHPRKFMPETKFRWYALPISNLNIIAISENEKDTATIRAKMRRNGSMHSGMECKCLDFAGYKCKYAT
jgi:hypothetical protein